jgi:hypothetical protein
MSDLLRWGWDAMNRAKFLSCAALILAYPMWELHILIYRRYM